MAFLVGKYGVGWSPLTHRPFVINLAARAPDMGEQGKVKSIFDTLEEEHPDDLVHTEGLEIYQKMMRHPTIKAGSQLLAVGIVAPGYDINPAVTGEGQYEEHATYVREQFEKLPGSFRTTQIGMLSSRTFGASFNEKVWSDTPIENGDFRGKFALAGIKTKPPFKYGIRRDDYGNTIAIVYRGDIAEDDEFDPQKWCIVTHDAGSVFGNPLGLSQLRPAFIYWKAHKLMFPKWGTFVEKTAAGVPVISYPVGTISSQVEQYEKLVKNIAAGSAVAKPENVILDWAAKQGSSHLEFLRILHFCERKMLQSILIPDQLGIGPEANVGSMAKAKVHENVFAWVQDDMDSELTSALNDDVIPYIVGVNWDTDRYPKFVRRSRDPEEAAKLTAQFITAVEKGCVGPVTHDDINRVRQSAGFSELDEATWKEWQDAEAGKKASYEPGLPPKKKDDDEDNGKDGKQFAAPYRRLTPTRIATGLHVNTSYLRELTEVEKKAGLRPKRLAHDLDKIQLVSADLMSQSMETARNQTIKRLAREGLLDGSATEVALWEFGRENGLGGNAKQAFRDAYLTATTSGYLLGAFDARTELTKATGGRIEFTDDAVKTLTFAEHGTVIVKPKEAAAFWSQLSVADRAKARALKAQSFYVTGLYLEPHGELLRRIKQVIQTGFDTGSWGAIEGRINALFDEWLGSGRLMPREGGTFQPYTRWHTETIIRNASMRAYNQGKLVQFANSGAWVERLQWSSIMDTRTTDYCDSMDTVVFNRGEIDVPPAHHDCRSTIFAVTSGSIYRTTDRDVLIRRQALRDPDFGSGVLAI